jgi:kynurenine 3-monooxygenase
MDLEKNFLTEYFSKYSLVTFNENIGYHEAMTKGRAQDKALLKMVKGNEIETSSKMTKSQLEVVLKNVKEETATILNDI